MRTEIDQEKLARYKALAHLPGKTIETVAAYALDDEEGSTGERERVVVTFTDGSAVYITSAEPYDHQSWLNVDVVMDIRW